MYIIQDLFPIVKSYIRPKSPCPFHGHGDFCISRHLSASGRLAGGAIRPPAPSELLSLLVQRKEKRNTHRGTEVPLCTPPERHRFAMLRRGEGYESDWPCRQENRRTIPILQGSFRKYVVGLRSSRVYKSRSDLRPGEILKRTLVLLSELSLLLSLLAQRK